VQFANGLNQFADASQEAFRSITPTIQQNLLFVQQITNAAGDVFEQLKGIDWNKLPSADDFNRLTPRLGTAVKIVDSMSGLFGKIDAILPSHPLAARIQHLQTISEQLQQQIKLAGIISTALRENSIPPADIVDRLNEVNSNINTGIDRFLNTFDSQIIPALTAAADQLKSVLSTSANTLQAAKERLPDIAAILATAKEGIQFGQTEL
jgi:putative membrane protein